MRLADVHTVYMLGIGGIGMSALARYLHLKGKQVTGYDRTETKITRELNADGIAVHYHEDIAHLDGADLIIYTPAIPKSHIEFVTAMEDDLPMFKRAEVLGWISQDHKTIAVAGTHGKTTTSALTAHILRECGIDCTAFVGGIVNSLGSNFVFGESEWLVVEADEFDRSFLQLSPDIEIITAIDPDHLDIYGDGSQFEQAYVEFVAIMGRGGTPYLNEKLKGFAQQLPRNVVFYGYEDAECRATNIAFKGLLSTFDFVSPDHHITGLELSLSGRYNVENAVAAISVALEIGASPESIPAALRSFAGIWRRFDVGYTSERFIYIDDYAHHPEEIKALLSAVREMYPDHTIRAIFQPHLFSRTRDFAEGFSESLSLADEVVLVPIYPAREEPIPGVTSEMLLEKVTATEKRIVNWRAGDNPDAFVEGLKPQTVVLTVGAGDINLAVSRVKALIETADKQPQA